VILGHFIRAHTVETRGTCIGSITYDNGDFASKSTHPPLFTPDGVWEPLKFEINGSQHSATCETRRTIETGSMKLMLTTRCIQLDVFDVLMFAFDDEGGTRRGFGGNRVSHPDPDVRGDG